MRTIFFVHENFVKRHQTSKRPSSSFGGLQFFVKRENLLFRDSYPKIKINRQGEVSDRDSDPAPFVRNSYIPETQQYLNYYGSQCYYEEPQALPQYYYFPQSQPQGPQVEGAGASIRNINSRSSSRFREHRTKQ